VAFACAWPGVPAGAAAPRVMPGVFLYASPALGDPNLAESVVLLVPGSMGLIVNRPTRVPVREAIRELAETRGLELPLYEGGPVQTDVVLALVRSAKTLANAHRVLPDVQLSAEPRRWKTLARDDEAASRLRVYAGYAGWGPGQRLHVLGSPVYLKDLLAYNPKRDEKARKALGRLVAHRHRGAGRYHRAEVEVRRRVREAAPAHG
jgi:putative AlgH/UPF0301 family transcriptional regulator